MLLGKWSSSCLPSGATCGICHILADTNFLTISVACSEHSNRYEAFVVAFCYLHEI